MLTPDTLSRVRMVNIRLVLCESCVPYPERPVVLPQQTATSAAMRKEGATGGRSMVVDLDLEKFFDKVNHDVLMARLKRKISDKRLLYYIRQMLKAGVIDERA